MHKTVPGQEGKILAYFAGLTGIYILVQVHVLTPWVLYAAMPVIICALAVDLWRSRRKTWPDEKYRLALIVGCCVIAIAAGVLFLLYG